MGACQRERKKDWEDIHFNPVLEYFLKRIHLMGHWSWHLKWNPFSERSHPFQSAFLYWRDSACLVTCRKIEYKSCLCSSLYVNSILSYCNQSCWAIWSDSHPLNFGTNRHGQEDIILWLPDPESFTQPSGQKHGICSQRKVEEDRSC